jgi:hypothetical protein
MANGRGSASFKKKSGSFLKKRTKTLLSVSGGTEFTYFGSVPQVICKSFLLLFFKKEVLFLLFPVAPLRGTASSVQLCGARPAC